MAKDDSLTYLAIAYMEMLEGSTMLLKLLEVEASEAVMHLKREQKQRMNRVLTHLKALKQLTIEDTFANEHQAFASDWYKYDDFRKDAAYFARVVLWLTDRTNHDETFAEQVEEFIKMKAGKGIFPDELIEKMRIR